MDHLCKLQMMDVLHQDQLHRSGAAQSHTSQDLMVGNGFGIRGPPYQRLYHGTAVLRMPMHAQN